MKRFPNGARVCFVGGSIIRSGIYLKHIVSCYRTEFPDSQVEFYNCGISGGDLGNVMKIFDEDIAIYDPTHVVLMIGTNDARMGHLKSPASKEKYASLFEAYELYRKRMQDFYSMLSARGIKLTLCTLTPYAEYQNSPVPPYRGAHALILGYSSFIAKFASENGLELCDLHSALVRCMQSEVLFGDDRTHPTPRAHALMARAFLASQGIDYQPRDTFEPEIEEWYEITQNLRNIITTEFLTLPDYETMPHLERHRRIVEYSEKIKSGECEATDFIKRQIEKYMTTYPKRKEYTDFVISFMKKGRS